MRKLSSAVAIIAARAIAAPASAQRFGPGPGAQTGTGPDVIPPGGYGPSSPMFNVQAGYPYAQPPAAHLKRSVRHAHWQVRHPKSSGIRKTNHSAGVVPNPVAMQSR